LTKKFLDGVHGLRAIAAVAVVVYHAGDTLALEKYQGLTWMQPLTRSLTTGVDIFFVISGFVISLPFFLGRTQPLDRYFTNRLLRIYPMALITALIFAMFNWGLLGNGPTLNGFLSSFLLVPSATPPMPVVLWTLKQELLFYAVFSLVLVRPNLGLAVVFGWAILSPLVPVTDSAVLFWLFHPKNIEFGFGIAAAYLFVSHKIAPAISLWVAFVGFGAFGIVGVVAGAGNIHPVLEVVLLGAFGLLTIYGVACAGLRLPRFAIFLGTASYSIYLIHYFFISAFNKLLVKVSPDLPGIAALAVLTVLSVLAGCGYYWVFERRIEDWRKKRQQ
jgi:exopolysaccharide production protein ExoZ